MFAFPEIDTKTIVLVLALLSAVVLGAMFGLPYYKEGLTTDETPKPAKSKTVYETSMNMDNDGEELNEPMPFEEGNTLAQSLKKCKKKCADLAACVGFTTNLDLKQCTLKSSKGADTEATNISGFWKAK